MNRRSNVRLTALMAVSVFMITAVVAFVGFRLSNNSVSAATLTDYGNVMSDYTIRDYNSMSETDIQAFLTRVNGCGNRNYSDYVYLSTTRPQYTWHWRDGHFVCISEERFEVAQPTRSWSSRYNVWYDDFTASPRFGDALAPGEGASAASIIYKAAQDYKINPKVIITFLQKEQGLITDPIPNSRDYGVAMGYNCPDSGRCPADENDRGFSTQVFHMAKRLDEYMSGDLNYFPGNYYVFDGQIVYIRNTATAGLYTYTPHISDKINLYRIYTGWFDGINGEGYSPLSVPRNMRLKTTVRRINPYTEETVDVLEKGMIRKFVTKIALKSGGWCLRTEYSTYNYMDACIKLSDLEDYYDAFQTPRYMRLKRETNRVNPYNGEVFDTLERGRVLRYTTKIYTNGKWYYRTQHMTDHSMDVVVPADCLEEVYYEPFNKPRYLLLDNDADLVNPYSGEKVGSLRGGEAIKYTSKILINNKWYYRSEDSTNKREDVVVDSGSLTELPDYEAFINPRSLITSEKVDRINPYTGEKYDELEEGRTLEYTTKIFINEEWYYRTRHMSENGMDVVVPASSLSEL